MLQKIPLIAPVTVVSFISNWQPDQLNTIDITKSEATMFKALFILASLVSASAFAPVARTNARSSLKVITTTELSPINCKSFNAYNQRFH